MINTEIINNKKMALVSDLKLWADNHRTISPEDFERLKEELDLGVIKPQLVLDDGTVLGGNQRLKAFSEKKVDRVWVTVIELKEENGKIISFLDGVRVKKEFKSREEAMFTYAAVDNDRAGMTDKKKLIEYIEKHGLFDVNVKVDLGKATVLSDLKVVKDIEKPEVQFTEELLEEHNYIVLYFDNEIDWLNLQSLYPLKTVKALDSKVGFTKMGIGRVVKGIDFINKLTK